MHYLSISNTQSIICTTSITYLIKTDISCIFKIFLTNPPLLNQHITVSDNIDDILRSLPLSTSFLSFLIHLESDRNNYLNIIMLCITSHLTRTFGLNYPEIPDSCIFLFCVSHIFSSSYFCKKNRAFSQRFHT